MNILLLILRRMALGGIIVSIAGFMPLLLVVFVPLYLLLAFFTWLSAKNNTERISEELGVDIPYNNYFVTLFRGLWIDLISPIGEIIGLFKDSKYKVVSFIFTYLIIISNVIIIVLVWLARLAFYANV